jgi:hypothetical protein
LIERDLEAKIEEATKATARASKKLFVFIAEAEAAILKGSVNFATFIPKHILDGLADKSAKVYRGKQPLKKLLGSGAKLENIPINAESTKDFESVARKYGVDYSLQKTEHGGKEQCLVFFKAKDINVLIAAFKDYSAKITNKEHEKSINQRIKNEKSQHKYQQRQRQRTREKKREREETAL